MPTRQELNTSITTLITPDPKVSAADHRQANQEMLNYVDQQDNALSTGKLSFETVATYASIDVGNTAKRLIIVDADERYNNAASICLHTGNTLLTLFTI